MGYLNSDGLETQIQYIKSYVQDEIKKHASIPIGHEYFSMNPNVPQGSLPLIGGVYSRETYADLWDWVQTQTGYLITDSAWVTLSNTQNGNVPFYSSGDGSTTFRVPSLKCWIKGTDGVETVGTYLDAGLPNITGEIGLHGTGTGTVVVGTTGAFGHTDTYSQYRAGTLGNAQSVSPVSIDASRSSSIYGNANTVQPESIVGMWLVKAYGTVVDTGTIDEQAYIDDRYNAMKNYVDGKFESVVASGENYVRYDSGIQVCFGSTDTVSVPANIDTSTLVTFPVPFVDRNYTVDFITEFINSNGWRWNSMCVSGKTTTQAYLFVYINSDLYNCKFNWIAIGRWK